MCVAGARRFDHRISRICLLVSGWFERNGLLSLLVNCQFDPTDLRTTPPHPHIPTQPGFSIAWRPPPRSSLYGRRSCPPRAAARTRPSGKRTERQRQDRPYIYLSIYLCALWGGEKGGLNIHVTHTSPHHPKPQRTALRVRLDL